MARNQPARGSIDIRQIERGWDVFGADDAKVGDVSDVRDTYIVVSSGWIFTSERYIPVSAIAGIEHDRVYLDVSKDEIEAQGWDQPPAPRTMAAASSARAMDEPPGRAAEPTMRREGVARQERPRDDGDRALELREEELRARKEMVDAGEVELRTEVVSREKTIDVPITREEVYIERHAVDRRPSDRPIGEGETIEIPLHEDKVTVDKQAVVYGEIEIDKRQVQETERVSGTVRREEARIEREGDVDVRGSGIDAAHVGGERRRPWSEASATQRQAWEQRHGTSGRRWEDVEPARRFGHEMTSEPRHRERDWAAVESDLRSDYPDWARRQGYRADAGAWEDLKDDVREAFEAGRPSGRRR
jgi:uncharacterized protein (TIGR02271 family)